MHFTTCILYSFLFALSLTLLVHATTTKTFLESLQMNNKNNDDKDLLRRMNEDTGFSFTAEKRSLRTRSRIARAMKRNGSLLPDIVFPSITTQKPQAAAPQQQQQQQQAVSYYPYSLVTPQYQTYPSSANTALYYSPPANANNNPSPPITQNSVPSYVAPLTSAKNKKKEEEEEDDDDDDEEEEDEDEDEEDEEDYDADDLVTRRR